MNEFTMNEFTVTNNNKVTFPNQTKQIGNNKVTNRDFGFLQMDFKNSVIGISLCGELSISDFDYYF